MTTFSVGVGRKVLDEAMVVREVAADLDRDIGSHCMVPLEACRKDSASLRPCDITASTHAEAFWPV